MYMVILKLSEILILFGIASTVIWINVEITLNEVKLP